MENLERRDARRAVRWPVTVLVLLAALAGGLTLAARGWAGDPAAHGPAPAAGPRPVDLVERIDAYTGAFAVGAYTAPDADQRRAVADGVVRTLDGRPDEAGRLLAGVGYRLTEFTEAVSGRRTAEIADASGADPRGWGRIYLDLSTPAGWSAQVPHPVSDSRTEILGAELFRQAPGGVLVLAGAHRRAGADGSADVAHRGDTVFAAVVEALATRGLPGLQLHGFDEGSLPGTDAVVSSGAGTAGEAAERTAAALEAAGLVVCRPWQQKCGQLAGTTNVGGRFAAGLGVTWLHVELANALRTDPARRAEVVEALAATARAW
ncbi:hypothetical protein ABZW10_02860 [Kitasatospora sp. NPDC004723]|uniref:hypothetical protein n=1 Tax=Kitasatospora sp. NPDC004723 TaxID=3154288 RepID=UPI0033A926FD